VGLQGFFIPQTTDSHPKGAQCIIGYGYNEFEAIEESKFADIEVDIV
jgi:hypothetical protein